MKYILIAFLLFINFSTFSQQTIITVSTGNSSLQVSLDSDNTNKLLLIDNADFSDKDFLTVTIDSGFAYKELNRSFFIYDSSSKAIKDFVLMSDETYCLKLNELKKLLLVGEEYFIYTTAVPKDPQKAMLVKPARQLVCKIKIL